MSRFFLVYLLPAGLINLGNVFAYLFQLTVARSLPVSDVGAFSAIFALTNVISAPAAILPFAIARVMIATRGSGGAGAQIVVRSALGAIGFTAIVLVAGIVLVEPLQLVLGVEDRTTAMLGLLLICTNLQYCLAVGWLQGQMRYILASLALASVPAMRCLFGLLLLVWWGGGVNLATLATSLPGLILFGACFIFLVLANGTGREAAPPKGVWQDFFRFLLSSSVSSILLLGFWNLDMLTVRGLFTPEASGIYAVAALLGRIPFLLSSAVVNVLFSEATRAALDHPNSERAARRVLMLNLALAGVLGLASATPISLFAEPIVTMFAGPGYAASAPILSVLSFVMAVLALLQVVVTFMMARSQSRVLWLLGIGLTMFLTLSRFAASPLEVVWYLAGSIGTLLAICLLLVFISPKRLQRVSLGAGWRKQHR
ncbi:hypothetical protein ACJMQP_16030 [Rhodopseudomonas palustris]